MIRPQPTAADIALATAFIDGPYREQVSASYHAFHRESLIRQTASAEMMKRQAAEHRAKAGSQPVKMEEAA